MVIKEDNCTHLVISISLCRKSKKNVVERIHIGNKAVGRKVGVKRMEQQGSKRLRGLARVVENRETHEHCAPNRRSHTRMRPFACSKDEKTFRGKQ